MKCVNEESKQLANEGREHHPTCVRIVMSKVSNICNLVCPTTFYDLINQKCLRDKDHKHERCQRGIEVRLVCLDSRCSLDVCLWHL